MTPALSSRLAKLTPRPVQHCRNLAIFPLTGDTLPDPEHILLADALAQGFLTVEEVSKGGSVRFGQDSGEKTDSTPEAKGTSRRQRRKHNTCGQEKGRATIAKPKGGAPMLMDSKPETSVYAFEEK